MSQKPRDGNILSFFKPRSANCITVASQATRSQPPDPGSPSPQGSQPFSSPLALRSTPQKQKQPFPAEISASDGEEDSDSDSSDNSFADLKTLIGKKPTPTRVSHKKDSNPFASSAKRTALEINGNSPIPIKHKFDFRALAKDAKRDDATLASSIRNQAAEETQPDNNTRESPGDSRSALVDIVRAEGGHDAEKVLRAVNRADTRCSQEVYCFFSRQWNGPSSTAPPKGLGKSPWKILTQGNTRVREQHLVSGVLHTLCSNLRDGLPDDLFQWLLDEACTSDSPLIRGETSSLVWMNANQVTRLITPSRLDDMFRQVGANMDPGTQKFQLTPVRSGEAQYADRDWSCLRSLLKLLCLVSVNLSTESTKHAALTLLRMSMDQVIISNMELLTEYESTIHRLAEALSQSSWKSLLGDVGASFYGNTIKNQIRINTVLCLPVNNPRTHDLRRQLATLFLFYDPEFTMRDPERVITIGQAIERLREDDFQISGATDFIELKANVILLDIVIDDGSPQQQPSPEEEKLFNEQVDKLANDLREIWKRINDSGMKLVRTEAKSVIEWVQQRLSYSVRTKGKVRRSIFDTHHPKDDPTLPQRQEYMRNFLNKSSIS